MVEENPELVNFADLDARTPLHLAACVGDLDLVKFLFSRYLSFAAIGQCWAIEPVDDLR